MMALALALACTRPPAPDSAPLDTGAAPRGDLPGDHLMAIFSCERTICEDPTAFNHEVWVASSDDGVAWEVPESFTPWTGSVPDLVRRGDTLYVYSGPRQLTRYDFTTSTWRDTVPYGEVEGALRLTDTNPIVGPDGLIHIFFMHSQVTSGDPAECPADAGAPCLQSFGSAIEVAGSDGERFEVQEGWRLTVELQPGERASDPDVFPTPEGYALYITWEEGTSVFTSDALHGSYAPVPGLGPKSQLAPAFYGVSAGRWDEATGQVFTYASFPRPPEGGGVPWVEVHLARHAGFDRPLTEADFEVSWAGGDGSGLPAEHWAASPGLAFNSREP